LGGLRAAVYRGQYRPWLAAQNRRPAGRPWRREETHALS
jgi:hypothetical protein